MNIRLVPNTGIQYVKLQDIDPNTKEFKAMSWLVQQGPTLKKVRFPPARDENQDLDSGNEESDEETGYTSRTASVQIIVEAAHALGGFWVPIPFERSGLWACVFLQPAKDPRNFTAVLAIDTTLEQDGNPQGLDWEEIGERKVAPVSKRFWSQECVAEYLKFLALEISQKSTAKPPSQSDIQLAIIAFARYLAEVTELHIGFENRPESSRSIPVNVVVDIGNTQTCVLLKETNLETREEALELVYPSNPSESYKCPFDTQFAFFEHQILKSALQGRESFRFLSQIQMGPMAQSALKNTKIDTRRLGMSSPKRYLWDDYDQVPWKWSLINEKDEQGQPLGIRADVLRRMDIIKPLTDPPMSGLPITPNYPRVACMIWVIIEILEQAFRQVNSTGWRKTDTNAPHCECRREIKNLVIMYPAGMHSKEIKNFEDSCNRACKLWAEFRTNPDIFCQGSKVTEDKQFGIQKPVVHIVCDEGLAIQACWLFGETMYRQNANVPQLIKNYGRPRGEGDKKLEILRLASLDIGGGTIDMAIADYENDPSNVNTSIKCRRLFYDGISRAGDEIVQTLLEEAIFPCIVKSLLDGSVVEWNNFFAEKSPNFSEDKREEARILRQQLVRTVWLPIALHVLVHLESNEQYSFSLKEIPVDLSMVTRLESFIIDQSIKKNPKNKRPTAPLKDSIITIDLVRMREVVKKAIGLTLNQCADIIDQYQCDLLIVGGKPSSSPAVREQIYAAMAVPPAQVIFLSELAVGDWFTFRGGGKIENAKTCGVFGCHVAFEAIYGQSKFHLELQPTDEPKTFIGYLTNPNDQSAKFSSNEKIDNETDFIKFKPYGGMQVAMRRIDDDRAEAKMIYKLRLKRNLSKNLGVNVGIQQDIEVKFKLKEIAKNLANPELGQRIGRRVGGTDDVLELQHIKGLVPGMQGPVDASEAMELVLKTTLDLEGYWLDTGQFRPLPPLNEGE